MSAMLGMKQPDAASETHSSLPSWSNARTRPVLVQVTISLPGRPSMLPPAIERPGWISSPLENTLHLSTIAPSTIEIAWRVPALL